MVYYVVVIYNKRCEESITVNSLLPFIEGRESTIIIFDNSTELNDNYAYCQESGFLYYSLGKNVGLSKAYNYVIAQLDNKEGLLVLLDDDTRLTEKYIHEVYKIDPTTVSISLPIVKTDRFILSPSNVRFNSGSKRVRTIDDIDYNRITGINTGMVVDLQVYQYIHYDESLFLDCVDHAFMREARNNNIRINILDAVIFQNYSREEIKSIDQDLNRFLIYRDDFKRYSSICHGELFYCLSIVKLAFHYCIKHKTFVFLKRLLFS